MGISKRVDSTGINRLALRLQKLHFMKPLFPKNQKLKKKNQDTSWDYHFCRAHLIAIADAWALNESQRTLGPLERT